MIVRIFGILLFAVLIMAGGALLEYDKDNYDYFFTKVVYWLLVLGWFSFGIRRKAKSLVRRQRLKKVILGLVLACPFLFMGGWSAIETYNWASTTEVIEGKVVSSEQVDCPKVNIRKLRRYQSDGPCFWSLVSDRQGSVIAGTFGKLPIGATRWVLMSVKAATGPLAVVPPIAGELQPIIMEKAKSRTEALSSEYVWQWSLLQMSFGLTFLLFGIRWLTVLTLPIDNSTQNNVSKRPVPVSPQTKSKERVEPKF